MQIIVFFLMNSIAALSSFLLNYKIFRPGLGDVSGGARVGGFSANGADFYISWFILYLAQIIFSEIFLGIFGFLYLKNVILLNLLILLAVWLAAKKQAVFSDGIGKIDFEFVGNKIIFFAASAILCFALAKICMNLANPPFGWDSLNYHFSFPVEWLKHGNLNTPIVVSDDPSPTYYPINGSLFYLWLMLPLKNVFLADLGQLPFFILAFLAVYSIARKTGLNKEPSFYAAALFALIPNFFKQLEVAYVDIMVGALFLVCVNCLFLLNASFKWQNVLIYGLSLGLLIGTKTVALPYSPLLAAPFIVFCFRNIRKSYLFLVFILAVTALGGFSYIRNFLETGNPLYPLNVKLLGKDIFKGVIDAVNYRAHFTAQDYRLDKALFHEGLGMQSLIFILPGLFLALPSAFLKKKKELNFNLVYFFILPFLLYLVYRYIIPLANLRYLYSFLGLSVILGFYAADILGIPKFILRLLVMICALASMAELAKHGELAAGAALTFILFLSLPYLIKTHSSLVFKPKMNAVKITEKKPQALVCGVLFFIFLTGALIFLNQWYIKNESSRYAKMLKYSGFWPEAAEAWDWLDKHTGGDNIAYVGRPVPFPLYGANFKNNVYYVSVNRVEPAKLHYFSNSHYSWGDDFLSMHKNFEAGHNYRSNGDYAVWLDNLLKRKTDYLFIYSLHQTEEIEFPVEDGWAMANPAKFMPVFANAAIHIYQILK